MVSAQNRTLATPVGATYKFGPGANWLMTPNIKLGVVSSYALDGEDTDALDGV